jgi:hypothetical protein
VLSLSLLLGCAADPADPEPEAQPGAVAAMRMTAGPRTSSESTVTVERSGRVLGAPLLVSPDELAPEDGTLLEITFLDAAGRGTGVRGSALQVTSRNPALVTYGVGGPFRDVMILGRYGTGSTELTLQLVRTSDQLSLFGPIDVPVSVRR